MKRISEPTCAIDVIHKIDVSIAGSGSDSLAVAIRATLTGVKTRLLVHKDVFIV